MEVLTIMKIQVLYNKSKWTEIYLIYIQIRQDQNVNHA